LSLRSHRPDPSGPGTNRGRRTAVGLVARQALDGANAPRYFILRDKETFMLYTIAVVLLVLWLLGLVTSTTVGGFIHILLVIAVVIVLLRVISGRRVL
jgi:hypothetical protein